MKKIFVTIATIGLLATGAYAADGGKKVEKTVNVSYTVETQFEADFSNAKDVVWVITPSSQNATFMLGGKKLTAFYSLEGDYMGVTQYVGYTAIAQKAQKEIADKYNGYAVSQVIKLVTNDPSTGFDQTVYFVDLKNASDEILVRVTPEADVYFFKQVK